MKRPVIAGLVAAWLFTGADPHIALAQTDPARAAAAPAAAFDAIAKRQAIATAGKLLIDDYVVPDTGAKAAAMLTQNLSAGKYDSALTPDDFAVLVNKDLQDLTNDKHLRVFLNGRLPDMPAGPPASMGVVGFAKADRLKGNIGYIQLNSFHAAKEEFGPEADKVMALEASTDALIIDLRYNSGGESTSEVYMASFFFDTKTPVPLIELIRRKPGSSDFDHSTDSTQPTPVSYLGRPVYLITSQTTFSAAEAFAYELQAEKRATVVGDITGGGAHMVGFHPIGYGMTLLVPFARSENPVTHGDWEGKGVRPDVAVPSVQAFASAYAAALRSLRRPAADSVSAPEAVTEVHLLRPPHTGPSPGGEAALRQWVAGMSAGHPQDSVLSAEEAKNEKPAVAFFQQALSPHGVVQSVQFVEVELTGHDVYDVSFADKSVFRFHILMGADGKISEIFFAPV